MSVSVQGYEPGSNLKLITKQLKAVAKGTSDSFFVCVGDTIETEEPDYLKYVEQTMHNPAVTLENTCVQQLYLLLAACVQLICGQTLAFTTARNNYDDCA